MEGKAGWRPPSLGGVQLKSYILITGSPGVSSCEADTFETRSKVDSSPQLVFPQPAAAQGSEWPFTLQNRKS